jgi:hypothetical protein
LLDGNLKIFAYRKQPTNIASLKESFSNGLDRIVGQADQTVFVKTLANGLAS